MDECSINNSVLSTARFMALICLARSSLLARAVWYCDKALLTSAPALSRVCRNESLASSCWAFMILTRARLAPALKMGCKSEAAALSNNLPGLTMIDPALLVHPAAPLRVMEG